MERHVSLYRIHLNVCLFFGTRQTDLAEDTLFFLTQEVADDILYIQSQNQGLQVQTQNQRALLAEIANLLVRFPLPPLLNVTDRSGCTRKPSMLTMSLSSPSLKSPWRSRRVSRNSRRPRRICTKHYRLDETEVGRNSDTGSRMTRKFLKILLLDMAAGMERLSEYRTYNSQFCKRIFDYLSIMFTAQVSRPTLHIRGRS